MQPTPGDVHVNTPLTNISIAYIQSSAKFVASLVFPNVPVAKQADRYWTFDRGEFNRDEARERAPGTESAGGGFAMDSTPTYYCRVVAFHKDVNDQTRANADSQVNLDRLTTRYVTSKLLIRREKSFVARYFQPGVWAYEFTGVAAAPAAGQVLRWSDANSNPIEDIRLAKRTMLENTGFEPNTLTLGKHVYDALLDHPDLVDRIKYGQTPGAPAIVQRQAMAALFEVERILVMEAIENIAPEGQTAVHRFIGPKRALLTYAPPEPALETPSAGYTFSWTGFLGASQDGMRMKSFRMEPLESDRLEGQMAYDQRVVASDLGLLFNDIVA